MLSLLSPLLANCEITDVHEISKAMHCIELIESMQLSEATRNTLNNLKLLSKELAMIARKLQKQPSSGCLVIILIMLFISGCIWIIN
jgi:hypothetical protein